MMSRTLAYACVHAHVGPCASINIQWSHRGQSNGEDWQEHVQDPAPLSICLFIDTKNNKNVYYTAAFAQGGQSDRGDWQEPRTFIRYNGFCFLVVFVTD